MQKTVTFLICFAFWLYPDAKIRQDRRPSQEDFDCVVRQIPLFSELMQKTVRPLCAASSRKGPICHRKASIFVGAIPQTGVHFVQPCLRRNTSKVDAYSHNTPLLRPFTGSGV